MHFNLDWERKITYRQNYTKARSLETVAIEFGFLELLTHFRIFGIVFLI